MPSSLLSDSGSFQVFLLRSLLVTVKLLEHICWLRWLVEQLLVTNENFMVNLR